MVRALRTVEPADTVVPPVHPEPGWPTRLQARLLAHRLDGLVEAGAPTRPRSALAAHQRRLATRRERDDLARSLLLVVRDAVEGPDALRPRVPVHRADVLRQHAAIDDVRARLMSDQPVLIRGVARLRILLADGSGPIYRPGRGSLAAALQGVLAAL